MEFEIVTRGALEYVRSRLLQDAPHCFSTRLGGVSAGSLASLNLGIHRGDQPERVLMEWNGMWNQDDLKLPVDWTIYQQITIVDMSTFDLYVKNMKSLLSAMVRNSELVICNRCDGIEDLERYKRMLMSMNTKCEIVFEDENGEIDEISEEDLPYDLNAPVVKISP